MNEPNDGLVRPRRLLEISPERPQGWMVRRLKAGLRWARLSLLRTRRSETPPTYMVRLTDYKVIPVDPYRLPEKDAELKRASIVKQWKPPGL